jgi:F-type H+-transporting ATPase subunit delta
MKTTRQTKRDAARLFRACTVNGSLDETRVRRAVQQIVTFKPRGYLPTLLFFRRLIQIDVARRTARVESAFRLPPEIQTEVQKDLAQSYGTGLTTTFSENPALIAGMRIKVGSDVYDGTVDARLNAIEESFCE